MASPWKDLPRNLNADTARMRRLVEEDDRRRRLEQAEAERLKASGSVPGQPAPAKIPPSGLGRDQAAELIRGQLEKERALELEARRRVAERDRLGVGPDSEQLAIPPTKPIDPRWPPMVPPLSRIAVRGRDGYGEGRNNALRVDDSGKVKRHDGVDLAAQQGSAVYAPMDGIVDIGDPYGGIRGKEGKLDSVIINGNGNRTIRMFYVKLDPRLKRGMRVKAGTYIGVSQSLQGLYPPRPDGSRMTDHVHVRFEQGVTKIDPTPWAREWQAAAAHLSGDR